METHESIGLTDDGVSRDPELVEIPATILARFVPLGRYRGHSLNEAIDCGLRWFCRAPKNDLDVEREFKIDYGDDE